MEAIPAFADYMEDCGWLMDDRGVRPLDEAESLALKGIARQLDTPQVESAVPAFAADTMATASPALERALNAHEAAGVGANGSVFHDDTGGDDLPPPPPPGMLI